MRELNSVESRQVAGALYLSTSVILDFFRNFRRPSDTESKGIAAYTAPGNGAGMGPVVGAAVVTVAVAGAAAMIAGGLGLFSLFGKK